MYLSGLVSVDPSQMSHVGRKPTRGFRRLAEWLTLGALTEQEERETFTAVSILQELSAALRSVGVSDVVRVTRDLDVIYDDPDGANTDDLELAIQDLARSESRAMQPPFQSLSMILEHYLPDITLIMEIKVDRVHRLGEHPIRILINGLVSQFQNASGEADLQQRLDQAFSDQSQYDKLYDTVRSQFEGFLADLEAAVRATMQVDDVQRYAHVNVVRPMPADQAASNTANQPADQPPVFQHFGIGSDALLYCWMWSSMMHSHNIHCHDTTIVNENGQGLVEVGPEGFDAGANDLLNAEEPLAAADAQELGLGWFGEDEGNRLAGFDTGESADGGSWFDSFGGDGGGMDFGGFE